MSASAVRMVWIAVLLVPAAVALADSPPTLNVVPSCDAAARAAIVAGRDRAACMADERAAEDTLKKNWSKYPSADKTQCVGMNNQGGPASYVELLSCLEIMRDAKQIRETDTLEVNPQNDALGNPQDQPSADSTSSPSPRPTRAGARHRRNPRS
jgi:hypothetical protein